MQMFSKTRRKMKLFKRTVKAMTGYIDNAKENNEARALVCFLIFKKCIKKIKAKGWDNDFLDYASFILC